MNRKFLFFATIIAIFIGFGVASSARADQSLDIDGDSWCGTTLINEGATYTLSADLSCPTTDGLIIGADNVTIDGGESTKYSITGAISDGIYKDGVSDRSGHGGVTIKNLNIRSFAVGVGFAGVINSTIQNVDASLGSVGIFLDSSSGNTLTGNLTSLNTANGILLSNSSDNNQLTANISKYNVSGAGINLDGSSGNTLTGNTISSHIGNSFGLIFSGSSSGNTLVGNTIGNNIRSLSDVGSNNYFLNNFVENANNQMLTFVDATRTKIVGERVDFSVSSFNPNGSVCNGCINVSVYPPAPITVTSDSDNTTVGYFTPILSGTYSLYFKVTDANGNVARRKMSFFVGNTYEQTTRFYLNGGVNPTHGQPYEGDSKSLQLNAPTDIAFWRCGGWIQASPDQIPIYPLANLLNVDINSWYKQAGVDGSIGVQRFLSYDTEKDFSNPVAYSDVYIKNQTSFTNLNWAMDLANSWYWLGIKLYGNEPHWITYPDEEHSSEPSYADFTYTYTNTPAIRSNSNSEIGVLSAAALVASTTAQITLENPYNEATSTTLVIDGLAFDTSYGVIASTTARDSQLTDSSGRLTFFANVPPGTTNYYFTLPNLVPTLATSTPTNLINDSATLNGIISDIGTGNPTERGFEYGTVTGAYTATSTDDTVGPYIGGSFSTDVSDLTCGTTYYYRAYAVNSAGIGYSGEETFETVCVTVPTLALSTPASSITTTSAILHATISDTGNVNATSRGFEYGTVTGAYTATSTDDTVGPYIGGSFSTDVSDLTCGTTYYYRAYATNSAGTGYSDPESTFVTSDCGSGGSGTGGFSSTEDLSVVDLTFGDTTTSLSVPGPFSAGELKWDDGVFTVTDPGADFKINSSDATVKSIRAVVNNQEVACANDDLTLPTTAGVYTITPSASLCAVAETPPPAPLRHTSGGFVVRRPILPPVVPISPQVPPSTLSPSSFLFTRPLYAGFSGPDVRQLQLILNRDLSTRIALSGVGSPGHETNYFGLLTKAALGKFQLKYGIVKNNHDPGFGYLGPKTRAFINQLIKK